MAITQEVQEERLQALKREAQLRQPVSKTTKQSIQAIESSFVRIANLAKQSGVPDFSQVQTTPVQN